jgi:hypothetical protein
MRNVPPDAQWFVDIDEQGNIRVFFKSNIYEMMYLALLDYHFGKMNFIELLNEWSRLLDMNEPNPSRKPVK